MSNTTNPKYESAYSGLQVDNAVSSFVNTIGVASKEDHMGDYKALLTPFNASIPTDHLLTMNGNGLVGDSSIKADTIANKEYVDNKVKEAGVDVSVEGTTLVFSLKQ